MFEKLTTRVLEMLNYMRDIRLAVARSQAWFKCDEQYRLSKASNPESVRNFVFCIRLSLKVNLRSTMLSNFQGKTAHLLQFSIAIILIKVKGAIFSLDADSSTSVEDAEANTQLPTVSTTSQLFKLNKTPIKLDRIS